MRDAPEARRRLAGGKRREARSHRIESPINRSTLEGSRMALRHPCRGARRWRIRDPVAARLRRLPPANLHHASGVEAINSAIRFELPPTAQTPRQHQPDLRYALAPMALFSSKETTPQARGAEPQLNFNGTFFGPNVTIDGTFTGSEPVLIEGTVRGKINLSGELRIGTKAR